MDQALGNDREGLAGVGDRVAGPHLAAAACVDLAVDLDLAGLDDRTRVGAVLDDRGELEEPGRA